MIYLAKIIPRDASDERGTIDVNINVLLFPKVNYVDSMIATEYKKMYKQHEKYQHLCYCGDARILDTKKVAFVTYKLWNEVDSESSKQMENVNSGLKRRRDSPEAGNQPQNKR